MSSGFNSNVRVGKRVYHVQTEDRGPVHRRIDTAVYFKGQVLRLVSSSYDELKTPRGGASPRADAIRRRVESQHRAVVEALRRGKLEMEPAAAQTRGIRARLRNAKSWLRSGEALLEIEVISRPAGDPQPGARVDVTLEGAAAPARWESRTDEQGLCELRFSLPRLDPEKAALVIRAETPAGKDTLRFALRAKAKRPGARPSTGS